MQIVDPLPDALRRLLRQRGRGAGHQHQELFTAVASHNIPRAYRITNRRGDADQRLVAHHVAVVIVVGFEIVDIEQQDIALLILCCRQAVKTRLKTAAVVDAGQRIEEAEIA